ncbi:MAG: hypothetical protein COV01_00350 [Candidatus Taylorbacteria bacterium CG10_big_fil_rev_8_21_14_0_10_41_48]|uniref:Uncharacterized protein n=1 Tax=Candidatus Taylorbacteria bacterium CG10_big_fil_rev_8_21_14_0_10_41_48 TaxID=1975024 RepID=A0A2M8LCV7_9BACT|nr:MAG: hypothetical protein COV01_00350 [Candidatus Taylorbacteria bacterium CG10_big_fil_rev_8_21_14_0_10_41_48]
MKKFIESLNPREALGPSSPLTWFIVLALFFTIYVFIDIWNQNRKDKKFNEKYKIVKRDK